MHCTENLYFTVIKYAENNDKFLHLCHEITSRIVTCVPSPQEEIWKDFSAAQPLQGPAYALKRADIRGLCLGELQWGNSFPTQAQHCSAVESSLFSTGAGSIRTPSVPLEIVPLLHN